MTELTLTGVRDDHVLVMHDEQGSEFTLPASEELFAQVRKLRAQSVHGIPSSGPVKPKVIQAMIRSGMTAQDVAEATGADLDHVQRYEGPILAERRHIAQQAGLCPVYPSNDHSQTPRPMAELALERLALREVDTAQVSWDAWRTETGSWHVELAFEAAGRPRTAAWDYSRGSVNALDDEARWLSDVGPTDSGPIPNYGSAQERVFNIEAESQTERDHSRDRQTETGRILESLRRRRGYDSQDTAPHKLHPVPAAPHAEPDGAHTALGRPEDAHDASVFAIPAEPGAQDHAPQTQPDTRPAESQRTIRAATHDDACDRADSQDSRPVSQLRPRHTSHEIPDQPSLLDEPEIQERTAPAPTHGSGDSWESETTASRQEAAQSGHTGAADRESDETPKAEEPAAETKKKGRSSVPSWEEIMFGTRRD